MRRLLLVGLLVAAVLAAALPATAKSFELPSADILLELQDDGSVLVTETITYDFDGPMVTMFACHPKGSARQRIVVTATLVANRLIA